MNKILLVDDRPSSFSALCSYFESNTYIIKQAISPESAMQIIASWTPDCILTEHYIPELDGLEFCRQVKSNDRLKHIPVIFLGTITGDDFLVSAMDAGADDCISKDRDIRVVKAKIDAMLRIKKMQEDLMKLRRVEAIKQIIATYNHEFNNPLTVAIGNVNWLEKNMDDPEAQRRLGRLSQSLQRMTTLVKQIRDLRDYVEESYSTGERTIVVRGQ